MAEQARTAIGTEKLTAIADRGYFKSEEIRVCDKAGITVIVAKSNTNIVAAEFLYRVQWRCGRRIFFTYRAQQRETTHTQ